MDRLRVLLRERKSAVIDGWLDAALSCYSSEGRGFFGTQRDPFANPVGHAFREGLGGLFDELLGGMDAEVICNHLDGIQRIRAVQEFTASQSVSFIFDLKRVVRDVLGKSSRDPGLSVELAGFDRGVDQLALFAFDVYSRCREELFELRVSEVKRNVSAIMERLGGDKDMS